jgi:hypothetical protein
MANKFGKIYKYPNAVQCLECGMILVSFDRHDYKTCRCPNETMIDGGHDYLRAGGVDLNKVQLLKFVRVKSSWKKKR